jgi:hypothetical protein
MITYLAEVSFCLVFLITWKDTLSVQALTAECKSTELTVLDVFVAIVLVLAAVAGLVIEHLSCFVLHWILICLFKLEYRVIVHEDKVKLFFADFDDEVLRFVLHLTE